MWSFASNCVAGTVGPRRNFRAAAAARCSPECSSEEEDEDEASPASAAAAAVSREEGLECPICWESFNIVENVPYVLWCGHTLCKNCIFGLQWAVVKFPTLPIQLPLFISCPWCNLLSLRLVYRGHLKFPRKNYFLLWMVETMAGDRVKTRSGASRLAPAWPSDRTAAAATSSPPARSNEIHNHNHDHHRHRFHFDGRIGLERLRFSLGRSLLFFVHLTAKFPLVVIFLLIVLYAIPASAAILALYVLVTLLFALPSFLILYFSYPSLDWLVREIVT